MLHLVSALSFVLSGCRHLGSRRCIVGERHSVVFLGLFEILEQIGCWHVEGGWLFLMYCI